MSRSQTSIAGHGPGIDLQALQVGVQQETAARSRFPVDDRDILAAQIFDSADSLRISPSRENTFLPHGKRNTATAFLGNRRAISGILDSPVTSSRRCVPAMWTRPCLRSKSACELFRRAGTSSTPANNT